jgi:hypothetical protein
LTITSATIVNRADVRSALVDELKARKRADPNYRVIDIGGRHNPWADEVTDAYVDVFPFATGKKLYIGDINDEVVWRNVQRDGMYDFAIISHVLEDIRYPMTALRWMPQIARSGFLGLPNRHTEFANGVSEYWLGQSHHSWMFTVVEQGGANLLRAVPKFACVEYFNHARPAPEDAEDQYGPRMLPWLRPELAGRDHEFGVRWEGDLPFEVPDYTLDLAAQVDMYRTLLAGAVEDPE